MSNYEKWTVVKLHRILMVSRSRIYSHLNQLHTLGKVARDGSKFWLTPLGNLPEAMSAAVNRLAHAIPREQLRVELTQVSSPGWRATVAPDGKVLFELRFTDGVRVSEKRRKGRPWMGIRLVRRISDSTPGIMP